MSSPLSAPLCASPIQQHLAQLHASLSAVTDGEVATYIPELAKANPDWFGICVVTTNGGVYEVGDSRQAFTIQSISKPFVYGLALEDHGRAEVFAKIGVEPTGDAFNSISLDPGTGRPRNPMINAGAIASTGLIQGKTPAGRLQRILDMFGLYAGSELSVDEVVYRSESETGHRNRAIGHLLRNFNILTEDPNPTLELYFKQCSILANCRDLAVMAATLANRGVNPITGRQAIRGEYVESVLGVMGTCGMYDYAGEWLHDVGLPAKSGVAGGIIAVLPGQLGIGVFSPRLDAHGNSVRGIRVCDELSRHWDLHLFNRPGIGRSAIRVRSSGAEFNSSRQRTPAENQSLREHGARIQLYQLQGNLAFASAEMVVRELIDRAAEISFLILDFKRVLTVSESACRLFAALLSEFRRTGRRVLFSQVEGVPALRRYFRAKFGAKLDECFEAFDDNDTALELCEDDLLAQLLPGETEGRVATVHHYDLLQGLSAEQIDIVSRLLQRRAYKAGDTVIEAGAEAHELFLLSSGRVSVIVTFPNGRRKRLATFSPGMAFGEMAVLDRAPRSAMIVADSAVTADVLMLEDFEALGQSAPAIKIRMLENLALGLCRKLRKANRELTALE